MSELCPKCAAPRIGNAYQCSRLVEDLETPVPACQYAAQLRDQIQRGLPDRVEGAGFDGTQARIAQMIFVMHRKINSAGLDLRREFERALESNDPDELIKAVAFVPALMGQLISSLQLPNIVEYTEQMRAETTTRQ